MKKRIVSILLTLAMLAGTLSCLSGLSLFSASAATLNDIPSDLKALIFDANFYSSKYQDLYNAFGTDANKLYNHWLVYGIREGRTASPYFDVTYYRTQNDQGLIDYCSGDNVTAMNHFLTYVRSTYEMTNVPKKLSPVFDAGYYAARYSDLNNENYKTEFDYLYHFVNYGVNQGRQGSAEFDPVSYSVYNDDVYNAYSSTLWKIYRHYMLHGLKESETNPVRALCAVKSNIGDNFCATITDKNSGKCLDVLFNVDSSKYPDKTAVGINTASGSANQLWNFIRQSDGTYKIVNVGTGRVLDNYGYYVTNGQISAYNDNDASGSDISSQRWRIYEEDGYCFLRAECSDHVADVIDKATADGSTISSLFYNGGDNQKFRIDVEQPDDEPYVDPVETITDENKLNAFSGNEIWVDSSNDPANNTSTLPLVKMYKKDNYQYYFYLPETSNLSALPVCFSGYSSVKIGQYDITSGYAYSFTADKSYKLYLNGEYAGRLTFCQSTSPAMYLKTNEDLPTETFAQNAAGVSISNKDDFETKGTIAVSEEGSKYVETKLKKIKGRGNASWSFSYSNFGKYSYNITLDSKTKLYSSMAKGKKFCLLANNGDESYMRNLYTFLLGDAIGSDFTPRFQYVDLYDNGEYMGSFMLTDKVEINSQSVDLSCNLDDLNEAANPEIDLADCTRMSTTGNINDASTKGYKKWVDCAEVTTYEDGSEFDASKGDGTYLLEFEMKDRFPNEISGFISNMGQQVVVKTPEFASKKQVDFISALFNKAEEVVYNPYSTLEELNAVIDVDSFIKVYLIQELSKNIDSCQTSYYLYYDSKIDSRLHAAPVWDYDMAYGQYETPRMIAPDVYGESAVTSDWHSKIKGIYGDVATINFQATVVNNTEVWNRVRELWNGEDGFYNTAYQILNGEGKGTVPYYVEEVRASAKMNESRWGFIEKDLILGAGLNDTGETYQETTDFFINWTTERLNWMNNGATNTTPLQTGAEYNLSNPLADVSEDMKAVIFDADYYAKAYPDVVAVLGTDADKLYNYWISYGITQGQCASPCFDVKYYMNKNSKGLSSYCRGDYVTALKHFLDHANSEEELSGHAKKLSAVFDSGYYYKTYQDLRDHGLNTEFKLLQHFAQFGMNEGRSATATFDPLSYWAANDSVTSMSDSYASYMLNEANSGTAYTVANLGDSFTVMIVDTNSKKALEPAFNVSTSQYPDKSTLVINTADANNANQWWTFTRQSDGSYKIQNSGCGRVIDVYCFMTSDGDIGAYNDNDVSGAKKESQRWNLYLTSEGDVVMRALCANDVAAVHLEATADGSNVQCSSYHGGANQKFTLVA